METCFARLDFRDDEVWKSRKPIDLRLGDEHVDLTKAEARRAACLEEARLAETLAPGVGLGVVPSTPGGDGLPGPGHPGEPLDWAFRMRRLPEANRADHRLEHGTLDDAHLSAVARRLAELHEGARGAAATSPDSAIRELRRRIGLRIADSDGSPQVEWPSECERIERWQLEFLSSNATRFERRARTDSIREGHNESTESTT